MLWDVNKTNPTSHIQSICQELHEYTGLNVSATYVKNVFKKWRWSWKKPQFKQINKYSIKNISYYADFLSWLYSVPNIRQVKFLDEVHFMSKGVTFFEYT